MPLAAVCVYLPGIRLTPTHVAAAMGLVAGITQINVPLPAPLLDAGGKTSISVNAATAQGTCRS